MNSNQFERYLRSQGIEVRKKPNTSHKLLRNPANGKMSELPTHGGKQQLGTRLMEVIKKQLGLK